MAGVRPDAKAKRHCILFDSDSDTDVRSTLNGEPLNPVTAYLKSVRLSLAIDGD